MNGEKAGLKALEQKSGQTEVFGIAVNGAMANLNATFSEYATLESSSKALFHFHSYFPVFFTKSVQAICNADAFLISDAW